MNTLKNEITLLAAGLRGRTVRLMVMVISIALFILSAAAPNATIGIGK